MSFVIHRGVPSGGIRDRLPNGFTGILPKAAEVSERCDLVVFDDAVVTSPKLEKAIRRLSKAGGSEALTMLFVASNFTVECRERIVPPDGFLAGSRDHHWTDASYGQVKVRFSCTVKAPDVSARQRQEGG